MTAGASVSAAAAPRQAEPAPSEPAGSTQAGQEALVLEWISRLSDADLAGMVRILDAVAMTTGTNGFAGPLDDQQISALASKLRGGLRDGTTHQLMVRLGDELVGIVTLERCSQPTRQHIVEIRRAAIPPHRRGMFLQRGWLEVLRKCQLMGWEVAQIDVSEDGPIALWERMGFRVFGRVADYARVGARKLEGVFMTLDVPAALRAATAEKPPGA